MQIVNVEEHLSKDTSDKSADGSEQSDESTSPQHVSDTSGQVEVESPYKIRLCILNYSTCNMLIALRTRI